MPSIFRGSPLIHNSTLQGELCSSHFPLLIHTPLTNFYSLTPFFTQLNHLPLPHSFGISHYCPPHSTTHLLSSIYCDTHFRKSSLVFCIWIFSSVQMISDSRFHLSF